MPRRFWHLPNKVESHLSLPAASSDSHASIPSWGPDVSRLFHNLVHIVEYKELDCAFPGSKFILTTLLDAAIWFDSLCKHSERTGPTPFRKIAYDYVNPWENREHHIRIYADRISNVIEHFRDRPRQLLTVCWEKGGGWLELCRFLGVKAPEMPFPHENRAPEEQPQIRIAN
jgi:hypothetical protein